MKKICVAAFLLLAVVACKKEDLVVASDAQGNAAVQLPSDVSAVDGVALEGDVTLAQDTTAVEASDAASADAASADVE